MEWIALIPWPSIEQRRDANAFARTGCVTMELRSTRDAYGDILVRLGEINQNVVVLDADLSTSTQTNKFAKKYPKRFSMLVVQNKTSSIQQRVLHLQEKFRSQARMQCSPSGHGN